MNSLPSEIVYDIIYKYQPRPEYMTEMKKLLHYPYEAFPLYVDIFEVNHYFYLCTVFEKLLPNKEPRDIITNDYGYKISVEREYHEEYADYGDGTVDYEGRLI